MKENPYRFQDDDAARIAFLIKGYIMNTLTEKEHDELDNWVNADDRNMKLFEDLTDEKNLEANLEFLKNAQSKQSYEANKAAGKFRLPAKRFRIHPAWVAAASVVLVLGLFFIYRYATQTGQPQQPVADADTMQLKPGGDRATLTLADGSIIDLTEANNGLVKSFSHVNINKTANGLIEYGADGAEEPSTALHTLSTPVGGQYQVRLPDGTKVWLNAATSLTYPMAFAANERIVQLDGEAYFEVSKNEKQPFHVMLSDSSNITVLGTHFNIMSYNNEGSKEVTLLEGSVKISQLTSHDSRILKPGQQAVFTHDSRLTIHDNTDTAEITGWKDGWFVFHDAPIESVMRQVERWYDAKIVYQGEIKQLFNATILRKESLSKLLHLLEVNGYVHFKTENKTIYVLP